MPAYHKLLVAWKEIAYVKRCDLDPISPESQAREAREPHYTLGPSVGLRPGDRALVSGGQREDPKMAPSPTAYETKTAEGLRRLRGAGEGLADQHE